MLKDKVAIVTGSTSGIGLGIASGLAGAGCRVMLNGFGDPAEVEDTRAELSRINDVDVLYSGADMSKPDQIEAMVDEAATAWGGVDIVVNNAGIQHVCPVDEFPG